MNSQRTARWAGAALLLAALVLYLLTLDNGLRPGELAGGDLITHQYAQVQGRPSNAPGYPLYTMGGWLWFHGLRALLPTANPTALLSSYSTFWALIALALLYKLSLDITGNWPVSLLSAAFYAVSYFFWFYAVSTEQYTSAVAQTLVIVLLAFRWDSLTGKGREAEQPTLPSQAAADRILLALAFVCGLILAHLVTVAFIVPPLLIFILSRQPQLLRRPKMIVQGLLLAALPLLSYSFVYIRGAQHPEWRGTGQWPSASAWFWDFVSTQQGRNELTWRLQPLFTAEFPSLIWNELTWIVLLGGLAGLLLLGRRRGGLLAGTMLITLLFSFIDRLGNWYQVIMPVYTLLVFSFAVTISWLWQSIPAQPPRIRRLSQGALLALLLGLILLRFDLSLPRANQRDLRAATGLQSGQAILADDPAPGAAVLGVYTETLSLRYLTDIWQERPDVSPVTSREARDILATEQRPFYVTDSALPILRDEVAPRAHLSSAGATLIAVSARPASQLPLGVTPQAQPVGDGLSLPGYRAWQPGPDLLRVRLYGRAESIPAHNWSISLRPLARGQLLAAADGGVIQQDQPNPVHGAYPTSGWLPGEVVADDYVLSIPPGQPVDGLQVVVYRPVAGGFENLVVLMLAL